MKKGFKYLIALTLALAVLIPLQAIAFIEDEANVRLYVGEKKTLNAVIDLLSEDNPENVKISWESEHPDIARIDSRGNVTGLTAGKARINATVTGGQATRASVIVEVISTVKDLKVNESTMWVRVGENLPIKYEVLPSNAFLKDVTFKSADSKIARVDSRGNVTGVAGGATEITVTTKDGNIQKVVKVNSISTVESVEFLEKEEVIKLKEGEKHPLQYQVLPKDAFYKDVRFESSASKIARVSSAGEITALAGGEATIQVITKDGNYIDSIKVEIEGENKSEPSELKIEGAEKRNIFVGQTEQLKATILPEGNNFTGRVDYESSDDSIIEVTNSGRVTGKAAGTATVTATIGNDVFDQVTFVVTSTVKGLEGPEELTVYVGEEKEVPLKVLPLNAYNKKILVSHNGQEFIRVNENKNSITGLKEGTVNALFVTEDGGFEHEMTIHVVGMVKSLDIPFEKLEMGLDPVVIEPVIKPSNAFNKKLKYEIVGEKNIISINSTKNEIKPLKVGETKVKVTTEDGGFTDEFTVVVKFEIKDIKIYDEDNNLVGVSDPNSGNPVVKPADPKDETPTNNPTPNENETSNNSAPSYVKKIIIQKLIDRTDNPLVKKALEQLLVKYS